ncbi:MAG: mycothione reductase, partial [Pseudonocardiales bacterium]|nr:mycothione reductase [Pseudonocardiales bacterium]
MADFDLAIIGTGSGNSLLTPDFDGKRVAIIEAGAFGGTCLNVGCIPTKMYVYAADVASTVAHAARFGIDARLEGVRWRDIRDRVFGRIDPISAGGERYRSDGPNTTLFRGYAEFTGPRSLRVVTAEGEERGSFSAEQIVIAAGGRPMVPDVVADSGVGFYTSDTIMRLPERPERLVILGDSGCRLKGGFVQNCRDPGGWPFARIAALAAARRPDLVIHVGDYYYRETPCPAGNAGCAGSPYGDRWATWKAELFDPAA